MNLTKIVLERITKNLSKKKKINIKNTTKIKIERCNVFTEETIRISLSSNDD